MRGLFNKSLFIAALLAAAAVAAIAKPRVLLLVDSSYHLAANEITNQLKSRAEIVLAQMPRNEPFPFTSQEVLANLDLWIGKDKWDLIYFNLGLLDLTYRVPGIKQFRVMSLEAGGQIATPLQEYRKNIEAIAKRLADTRTPVIWASTLPIKDSLLRIQVPGAEVEYNKIANEVMTRLRIQVSDMHTKVQSLNPIKPVPGRKATRLDQNPIHLPMIEDICKALKLTPRAP